MGTGGCCGLWSLLREPSSRGREELGNSVGKGFPGGTKTPLPHTHPPFLPLLCPPVLPTMQHSGSHNHPSQLQGLAGSALGHGWG